jgi:hypothetical protein
MTSARGIAATGGTAGVGTESYSRSEANPAFSSQRFTRAPDRSSTSATSYCLGGGAPWRAAKRPVGSEVSRTR